MFVECYQNRGAGLCDVNELKIQTPYPGMEKGDLIPDFISAIRDDRLPEVSFRDVFRVMDVCFAAKESAELG